MFLLVDAASVGDDPEVEHLLSFGRVEGITVEKDIVLVERDADKSFALVGRGKNHTVWLPTLQQIRRLADRIAGEPGSMFASDVIERALTLVFLAKRLDADAVVSPARGAFLSKNANLLSGTPLLSVPESLAMIGSFVRQRPKVPLGGIPLMVQQRTEVYPLTARAMLPASQQWWSSCVQLSGSRTDDLLGHAEAVFKRLGQAMRGRDAVHEALRLGRERAAILDSLYHFDVVLMSSVGALDALAQVAQIVFGTTEDRARVKWQNKTWRRALRIIARPVADIVKPGSHQHAKLMTLTKIRNSIHGVPLDECLAVTRNGSVHRAMISSELGRELTEASHAIAPLENCGIFVEQVGTSFLNIGDFTEHALGWTAELVTEIFEAMLLRPELPAAPVTTFSQIENVEKERCCALARVGNYPTWIHGDGPPASPSMHRRIMGIIHKARSQPRDI